MALDLGAAPASYEGVLRGRLRPVQERATGERGAHGVRHYLLSGLLVCEHCGGRFIATGKDGSHYTCSTHTQGGDAACPVATCIPRRIAESVVLAPVQPELLGPEAIERACELIRGWARSESAQITEGANPELEAIATEIADLEALIQARPARAGTLHQVVEDLRSRQANLKRGARREAQAKLAGQIPAEEAYRAAVAEMTATLESSNVEAARAALRSLSSALFRYSRTPVYVEKLPPANPIGSDSMYAPTFGS